MPAPFLPLRPGMRLGLIPYGWSDGFPRRMPAAAAALVRGRRVRLLGPTHSELIRVDLTDVPEAELGDEVVLLGRSGRRRSPCRSWAGNGTSMSRPCIPRVAKSIRKRIPWVQTLVELTCRACGTPYSRAMISRRIILSGLAATVAAGCTPSQPVSTSMSYPIAPPPPDRATMGLDAVIDLSRSVTVTDFRAVRRSGMLGVIHKATEGRRLSRHGLCRPAAAGRGGGLAMGRLSFRHGPDFGRAAGSVLPLRRAARSAHLACASISKPTRTTRATLCGSTRPRSSCRPWPRRPGGCRSSTCIRPGPMASPCRRRV